MFASCELGFIDVDGAVRIHSRLANLDFSRTLGGFASLPAAPIGWHPRKPFLPPRLQALG